MLKEKAVQSLRFHTDSDRIYSNEIEINQKKNKFQPKQ